VTRPMRRCAGLQLDESGLGLTPRSVGGGDTCPCSTRLACVRDRVLELAASRIQRGGVSGSAVGRGACPLPLESMAILSGPFTLRRFSQERGELFDRILRFGLRGLGLSPAGHNASLLESRHPLRPPAHAPAAAAISARTAHSVRSPRARTRTPQSRCAALRVCERHLGSTTSRVGPLAIASGRNGASVTHSASSDGAFSDGCCRTRPTASAAGEFRMPLASWRCVFSDSWHGAPLSSSPCRPLEDALRPLPERDRMAGTGDDGLSDTGRAGDAATDLS
jgi:hypothetical protein